MMARTLGQTCVPAARFFLAQGHAFAYNCLQQHPPRLSTMRTRGVTFLGFCHARKPACGACPIAKRCPAFGIGPTDPVEAAALVRTEGRR